MDTSEKYILMCEKSPIREEYERQVGDLLFDSKKKSFVYYLCYTKYPYSSGIHKFFVVNGNEYTHKDIIPYHYIPVFRQDQLQAMVIGQNSITSMLTRFDIWKDQKYPNTNSPCIPMGRHLFGSMEQLWLAFVMHEKYQKRWDDENWYIDIRTDELKADQIYDAPKRLAQILNKENKTDG